MITGKHTLMFLHLKTKFWALIPGQFIIHIISFHRSCVMKYVLGEHFVLSKTLNKFVSLQSALSNKVLPKILPSEQPVLVFSHSLTLPFFAFFPLSQLVLCTSEKSWPPALLYHPFRYWKIAVRSPSNLLQVSQTHFPQPLLVYHVLLYCQGGTKLDIVFQI